MNFITGEKIQFLCDHFVGKKKDFKFNPKVKNYEEKFIYLNHNKSINNKSLVFCYSHLLKNKNELINTLNMLKNKFCLVFHNSDQNMNERDLILFKELPLLQRIYTQNMNVNHKNVIPLPIGLANSMWSHGNLDIFREIYNMNIEKTKNIYYFFSIKTNERIRKVCYDKVKDKNLKWGNKLSFKEYLIELKKHKYSICPEGNGIDTHRFWECLYMNVIPICLKNKLVEYYSRYFPIVLLDDWSDLDPKTLEKNCSKNIFDHNYLNLNYIKELINK